MNRKLFKQLCMCFNKQPNEELYELWNDNLINYEPLYIETAIQRIMLNDKFFPTLSRVIEEINGTPKWYGKEIKNQEIDQETQNEFNEFQDFIRDFRNEKK